MNFPTKGHGFVLAVGVLLVAVGGWRLASEINAALAVDTLEGGFRNADGFVIYAGQQAFRRAVVSGDADKVRHLAITYLKTTPFDPIVMSLLAHAQMVEGDGDIRVLSTRFDQAVQIAPKNRLVRALRDDAQQMLLRSQPTTVQAAK